jgi:uncharacterized oxidoreductase
MEAEAFLAWVKASPRAEGVDEVLAPGEPELLRRAERRATGIPIDPATCEQLIACARHAGMPEERIARLLAGAA